MYIMDTNGLPSIKNDGKVPRRRDVSPRKRRLRVRREFFSSDEEVPKRCRVDRESTSSGSG
jgi:hypothetical protein